MNQEQEIILLVWFPLSVILTIYIIYYGGLL